MTPESTISTLDDKTIEDLKSVLIKCKATGVTIIIAEHRLHYLRELADRVLLMENGCIEQEFDAASFFTMEDSARIKLGLRSLVPPAIST